MREIKENRINLAENRINLGERPLKLKSLQEQIKEKTDLKLKEGNKVSMNPSKDPKNENLGTLLSLIFFRSY